MTISYFLYARRLHAATWFAPLWFLVQPVAAALTFRGVRKAMAETPPEESLSAGSGPDRTAREEARPGRQARKHPGVPDVPRTVSYRRFARFSVLAGTFAFRTSLRL